MITTRENSLLQNIVKYCERIESVSHNLTRNEFDNNLSIREIVCFNILQIGELAKHFEASFIEKHGNQPWKKIKGMRDRIAHGYGSIDWDIVWEIIQIGIKPLKVYCVQILKEGN